MSFKKIISIFFFLFLSAFLFSDTITLKNNETFEGKIIKEENDYVLILLGEGFNERTDTMIGFRRMAIEKGIKVTICRSIEEFETYMIKTHKLVAVS